MSGPGPGPSGLFLFDKPRGITSHDAVYLLRRKLGVQRIGHAGTLDPMATGLLILLVGAATRSQAALQGGPKRYSGTILFGAETDTWDAEGKAVAEAPPPPLDAPSLAAAVARFSGRIVQQVPPYSAVKVGGKKLYELARKGLAAPEVRREADVKWLSWTPRPPALDFEIECSGGTYIRSIACELGRALGSRAHLAALRRTAAGGFSAGAAFTRERLEAMTPQAVAEALLPAPGERHG